MLCFRALRESHVRVTPLETISTDPKVAAQPPESDELDSLLECLVTVGRLHGKAVSREAVVGGLPLIKRHLTPSLLIRAAERAGFSAKLIRRPLKKIPGAVLPVILVLKDNNACVLVSRGQGQGVEVILPELQEGSGRMSEEDLEAQYTGYAIFLKPRFVFEDRADLERVPRPSSWFWGTLWKFRGFYVKLLPASLLINLFAVATPLFIMNVYDRVVPNQAIETMWVLAIGALAVFGFEFIIRMLRGYFIDRAGKRADALMASALFEQILGIQIGSKPPSSGAFANQARAYETLREFFTSATLVALVDLPFVFLFIYLIFLFGTFSVAMVPFLALVVSVLGTVLIQVPLRRSVRKSYQTSMQRHAILVETITGLESIKGASAESMLQRRMEECVRQSADVEVKSRWYSSMATTFTTSMQRIVTVLVVVIGVYEIKAGNMTQGSMIACVILAGRGLAPLGQVASLLTKLQQSMTALRGLNQIMELPQEREAEKSYVKRPVWRPEIDFREVSFAYPRQQRPALNKVSFAIRPGERVAILGKTGSGKSTLLKLLMKFYPPSEGVLMLAGIDSQQVDVTELRRHSGYVPQEVTLFYGSVRDNILMGVPWGDEQALKSTACIAGVDRLVDRDPLGYDMPVGERGELISGGQRQAVAIARSLMAKPQMLIFDEPTTGMDANAEREFIEQLDNYISDDPSRTLVVATHKTTLLSVVNRIIVLDEGGVVADGAKQEVLAKLQKGGKAA
ncbi:MAG: type I secretion system permease/ATPase [Verrucomicrobiales bacterium]